MFCVNFCTSSSIFLLVVHFQRNRCSCSFEKPFTGQLFQRKIVEMERKSTFQRNVSWRKYSGDSLKMNHLSKKSWFNSLHSFKNATKLKQKQLKATNKKLDLSASNDTNEMKDFHVSGFIETRKKKTKKEKTNRTEKKSHRWFFHLGEIAQTGSYNEILTNQMRNVISNKN